MSPLTIGVLAVSMSVDAFIASLGRGATGHRPGVLRALKTGAIFGTVEMVTPLIGWALGMAASAWVAAVDHWVAFALLGQYTRKEHVAGYLAPTAGLIKVSAPQGGTVARLDFLIDPTSI